MVNQVQLLAYEILSPDARCEEPSRNETRFLSDNDLLHKPRYFSLDLESAHFSMPPELQTAGSGAQRSAWIKDQLKLAGFNSVAYRCSPFLCPEIFFLPMFWPQGLAERYIAREDDKYDARIKAAMRTGVPLLWDIDSLVDDCACPDRRKNFVEDFVRHDMCSGIVFSFPSTHIEAQVTIILGTHEKTLDWANAATIGRAYMLGMKLHTFVSRWVCFPGWHPVFAGDATIRRRILALLAAGHSDRDIARLLEMTPHNVDYHIRMLKKKLRARTRAQLGYIGGRLGI